MASFGYLVDTTKCTACRGCMVACKQWNQLPAETTTFRGSYQNHPDLTANNYTVLFFNEYEDNGQIRWNFTKRQCMHCLDPACVKVCPQKALSKTKTGAVVKDLKKCVGCQYCTYACPFQVPKYDKETDKTTKCYLCSERTAEGELPACVKACVTGALQFGERDEILAIARKRVEEIKDRYPRADVYGEKEVGGTNILYVLGDSPEKHGLPVSPKVSSLTAGWQNYVKPYGPWLLALTGAACVFSFFSSRLLRAGQTSHKEGKNHG